MEKPPDKINDSNSDSPGDGAAGPLRLRDSALKSKSASVAASAAPHRFSLVNLLCSILLTFSVFSLAFVPLRGSQDEWWHLKTGQWIWEHGGLPTNDIFTYTGENIRWYNHEWLSQLVFYGVFRAGEIIAPALNDPFPTGGLTALIGFKSLVVVLAFWLVAWLARQRLRDAPGGWAAACVIAVIAADISRRTIYPRPPIFSYVMFAFFLLVLYRWKQGRIRCGWLWLLLPLTVLWANLHGMVLLSVLAVGAFAGGEFLENALGWWRGKRTNAQQRDIAASLRAVLSCRVLFLTALTVAVALACMAQPSGYHIFFLGRNFTADPLLQQIILEMKPSPGPFMMLHPDRPWWELSNWVARPPGFWTPWVALAAMAVLLIWNRLRLPYAADYLLLGFFTYQGVMHWRLLPLFAIAAAGPVASLIAARLSSREYSDGTLLPSSARTRWQQPTFAIALAALVGWFNFTVAEPPPQTFFRRNLQMIRGEVASLADYPAPLLDYIVQSDLPPRMFSDSNYCGYFMWRLSPESYKLFTDNRFDVFGSEFVWEERTIFFALNPGDRLDGRLITEGWRELLRRYGVNFLVFRPIDRPDLFDALRRSYDWRLIYYYIAPQAAPRNWPLEGYYVWVRDGGDAAADLAEAKAAEIFAAQFPQQPLPSELRRLLKK